MIALIITLHPGGSCLIRESESPLNLHPTRGISPWQHISPFQLRLLHSNNMWHVKVVCADVCSTVVVLKDMMEEMLKQEWFWPVSDAIIPNKKRSKLDLTHRQADWSLWIWSYRNMTETHLQKTQITYCIIYVRYSAYCFCKVNIADNNAAIIIIYSFWFP